MKILSALTLIAVSAALMTPDTAKAGNKEEAIIGGIIGGIIIGSVLADDHIDTHVSVGYSTGRHSHGYWEWVTVKTWVPGYYERSCDRWGHPRKIWVSGRYTFTKKKVWVDGHHGHYSHSRHDNHWRDGRNDRRGGDRDHRRHDDGRSSQHVRNF